MRKTKRDYFYGRHYVIISITLLSMYLKLPMISRHRPCACLGVQLETWSIQLWDAMGYERVKTRMEDELGDLPQWISDLDGGFYKQDETIEYATPISHFVKDELWDKGDAKLSVTHDDQLLLKLQSKNNVITDEFNDALVDAIDLLENEHYTSMVIYADGNNFSVGANLFLMKKAHEDGLVDDVVAQSIDKLHYSFNRLSIV